MMLSDYTAGTISVVADETTVTGTGTAWQVAGFREGDWLIANGWVNVVASVDSNTSLTLAQPWRGGELSGASYRLRYMSDGSRASAQARQLIDMLGGSGNLEALGGLVGAPGSIPYFTGAGTMGLLSPQDITQGVRYDVQVDVLSGRDAYDGEPEGFAVLVSDVGDGRSAIYSRVGAAGNWADPAYITGPVGPPNTLAKGDVVTGDPGTDADFSITGDAPNQTLNLTIPRGDVGPPNTLIKGTVTTGPAGSDADISITGEAPEQTLNITIPRGDKGEGLATDASVDILSGRDEYDDEPHGFTVLVRDIGNGRAAIFEKESAATADWSAPAYITGESGAGDGDVVGPASATDGNIAVFDGVTGKRLKDGGQPIISLQDRSSVTYRPSAPTDTGWLYDEFPPSSGHGNTIIGAGTPDTGNADTVRTTIFGALAGQRLEVSNRVDAFGQGALRNARYAERVTAIGTLCMQWLGQDLTTDPNNKFYYHDLLWNRGTPVSDSGWDAFSLETRNPGIRAEIAAWENWPTSTEDVSYNVGLGRDSLVELVRGTSNTAVGYRSLGLAFDASENTAVGDNALFSCVFGDQNVGIGVNAGWYLQSGDMNVFVGRNAGLTNVSGTSNVIIGPNAGNGGVDPWTGSWNVFIGQDAGRKLDGTMAASINNRLYIQDRYTRNPLILGEFDKGSVGINVPIIEALKGKFHVYQGASGATAAAGSDAIVIENSTHGGLTFLTPNTSIAGFYFGDPEVPQAGGITYNHASDELRIRIAGANSFIFGQSGKIAVTSLPSSNPGAGSKQLWYDPSDGNRVKFAV